MAMVVMMSPSMMTMVPAMVAVPTMMMPAAMMVMTTPVHSRGEITCVLRCRGRCRICKRKCFSAVSWHRERHQAGDNSETKKFPDTHPDRSPFKQKQSL
jgi:hypothetical protein